MKNTYHNNIDDVHLHYNSNKKRKSKISKISIQHEAIRLLKSGFKITIIACTLDVSFTHLRNFFREIFAENPKGGQLPTIESLLNTQKRQMEATVFLSIYLKLADSDFKKLDLNTLLKSHQFYEELRDNAELNKDPKWKKFDINDVWIITKALINKRIVFKRCSNGCAYIEVDEQSTKLECPQCKLIFDFKKKPSRKASRKTS